MTTESSDKFTLALAAAKAAATEASAKAQVEIRNLHDLQDLSTAAELFTETWLTPERHPPTSTNLLRALSYSGSYVAGAFTDGNMVGGAVAFLAKSNNRDSLFSHSLAVLSNHRSLGVGYAIKLHQRMWSLSQRIDLINWTFDPLANKNAYFNLAKLGARGIDYLPNFYGEMRDKLNVGSDSDRVLVEWGLTRSLTFPGVAVKNSSELPDELSDSLSLLIDVSGDPQLGDLSLMGRFNAYRLQIPFAKENCPALRPSQLRAWHSALRRVMKIGIKAGYVLTHYTPKFGYFLTRQDSAI